MSLIRVSINNQQDFIKIDRQRVFDALRRVLAGHRVNDAEISVAVVDDARIHALNRTHLCHDYPTDVLSFVYDKGDQTIDGELVVSAETACRAGAEHDMAAHDELLLYLVHGTLHMLGWDDQTDEARRDMRNQERFFMRQLGIPPTGKTHDGNRQEMTS